MALLLGLSGRLSCPFRLPPLVNEPPGDPNSAFLIRAKLFCPLVKEAPERPPTEGVACPLPSARAEGRRRAEGPAVKLPPALPP